LFQILLKKGCEIELIAAPSKIAYGCCQAIKFKREDMELFLMEAKKRNLSPRGIYKVVKKGKYVIYEKIT
jgi:hypothetical protein